MTTSHDEQLISSLRQLNDDKDRLIAIQRRQYKELKESKLMVCPFASKECVFRTDKNECLVDDKKVNLGDVEHG